MPAVLVLAALVLTGCGGGGGSGGPGLVPDAEAPVITSGPTLGAIGETGVVISWTTNEAATSTVRLGATTAYGVTQGAETPTTTHQVTVGTLTPFTLYHFRVESADATGNTGTSPDNQFTTDRTLAIWLAQGWTSFAGADYDDAIEKFDGALGKSATSAEAELGKAWCNAFLGNLPDAVTGFTTSLSHQPGSVDAQAGRAAAAGEVGDHAQAIADAGAVLAADPGYGFTHLATFDADDLHLILAKSHYAESDYPSAQSEVDLLDPANELDPGAISYVVDLLNAIEALYSSVGGS